METITITVGHPPYGGDEVFSALMLASNLIMDTKINVFLMGEGVYVAKKSQETPENYPNMGKLLQEILKNGGKVLACLPCLKTRGLIQEDLIEGVKPGTISDFSAWIKDSKTVINF